MVAAKSIRLNIGCGNDYRKGWVNIDFDKTVKADLYCDVRNGLPFADENVEYINLSRMLIYIFDYQSLLDECYRVLVKEGKIEIRENNNTSLGCRLKMLFGRPDFLEPIITRRCRFWTIGSLKRALENSGFAVIRCYGLSETFGRLLPASLAGDFIMIGKKTSDSFTA